LINPESKAGIAESTISKFWNDPPRNRMHTTSWRDALYLWAQFCCKMWGDSLV